MKEPSATPVTKPQGLVPNVLSIYTPNSSSPIVGTNMRHVVSPKSLSNKMTADRSGGVGLSSRGFSGDVLIYVYTVAEN